MSAKPIRLLLNAAEFPFTYQQAGRSVLEFQDIAPRMPGSFYGSSENAEYGVTQLLYCENVLPYAKGLFSVGYGTQIAAITPATTAFDQAIQIRDAAENQFTFSPAGGLNYVYDPTLNTWTSVNPFTFSNTLVTRAYVNGRTFICYEKTKIIEYNAGTGLFTTVTLTFPAGFTIANVRGIGGASNYLLFFTDISIYWCTPLNILDFLTVDQGAGNQTPIDIKGQITTLLSCSGGFIVYTARNAVGATFTNNGNSPFVFKEIANCGGVPSWERVTQESDDGAHYIWGTNGLQSVNLNKATTLYPEVTDFLVGNQLEIWNTATKSVELHPIGSPFSVKLVFLTGRYLVISYGQAANLFDYALVLDTALNRWGKLAIQHCDAFMFTYPTFASSYNYNQLPGLYNDLGDVDYAGLDSTRLVVAPAKRGIAFLKNTGEVDILATDFAQTSSPGVIVIGHLQNVRQRLVTIHSVELEGVRNTPQVSILLSADGMNRSGTIAFTQVEATGLKQKFDAPSMMQASMNADIAIEGTFVMSTIIARVANNGYR